MATRVTIKHPQTGLIQSGYVRYSWTYLFFGFWVPLIRGELGVAALHFFFSVVTLGLWQFVVSFLYSKQYMTRKLMKGWVLADSADRNLLAAAKIGVALPATAP
jgi:hypothetical protein